MDTQKANESSPWVLPRPKKEIENRIEIQSSLSQAYRESATWKWRHLGQTKVLNHRPCERFLEQRHFLGAAEWTDADAQNQKFDGQG